MTSAELAELADDLKRVARALGVGNLLVDAAVELYVSRVVQELQARGWQLTRAPIPAPPGV